MWKTKKGGGSTSSGSCPQEFKGKKNTDLIYSGLSKDEGLSSRLRRAHGRSLKLAANTAVVGEIKGQPGHVRFLRFNPFGTESRPTETTDQGGDDGGWY